MSVEAGTPLRVALEEWAVRTAPWTGPKSMTAEDGYNAAIEEVVGLLNYHRAEAGTLDEAWAAAEAALPESKPPWMLTLHTYVREPDGTPFVEACAYAPMYEEAVQVFGDTVVDALLELAIELRALRAVPA